MKDKKKKYVSQVLHNVKPVNKHENCGFLRVNNKKDVTLSFI